MIDSFVIAIIGVILAILSIYKWIVIISALITWVNPDPYNPIVKILYNLTEPIYIKIRRFIPTVFGGIDLTPIVLLLAIQFLEIFIVNLFR